MATVGISRRRRPHHGSATLDCSIQAALTRAGYDTVRILLGGTFASDRARNGQRRLRILSSRNSPEPPQRRNDLSISKEFE